jgi:hypothetical protein
VTRNPIESQPTEITQPFLSQTLRDETEVLQN